MRLCQTLLSCLEGGLETRLTSNTMVKYHSFAAFCICCAHITIQMATNFYYSYALVQLGTVVILIITAQCAAHIQVYKHYVYWYAYYSCMSHMDISDDPPFGQVQRNFWSLLGMGREGQGSGEQRGRKGYDYAMKFKPHNFSVFKVSTCSPTTFLPPPSLTLL